jgi:hypothetical protein
VNGLNLNRNSKVITAIYFSVAAILIYAEISDSKTLLSLFKPVLIPTLMVLYFYSSTTRNSYYLVSLVFALCSNIFFLSASRDFLMYGMLAFMVYRILTIVVVLKLISKLPILPFVIACLPFVFIFSCLLNLTMNSLSTSFYPAVINAVLISILAGISLSNYVLDDNRGNSWLAISTLLAIVLVYLFMIQKYYFPNNVFQPISAFIFSIGHYAFYRFVIESEKHHENLKQ